jgi:hypothetical protein
VTIVNHMIGKGSGGDALTGKVLPTTHVMAPMPPVRLPRPSAEPTGPSATSGTERQARQASPGPSPDRP